MGPVLQVRVKVWARVGSRSVVWVLVLARTAAAHGPVLQVRVREGWGN